MKKRKLWIAFGVINFFLLFVSLFVFLEKDKVALVYNQDEMFLTRDNGETVEDGFYMDSSFSGVDVSIISPEIVLDKGIYTVSVQYEANTDFNTVSVRNYSNENAIYADEFDLKADKNQFTYHIWVRENNSNIRVFNHMWGHEDGDYLLVRGISIETSSYSYSNYWARCMLFLLLLNAMIFLVMELRKKDRKKLKDETKTIALSLIMILFVSSIPLFTDYFYASQDGAFHLMRIEGIKDGIRAGMFPVKIQPSWFDGNGYAVSVMYGDLFLYLPAILRILGVTAQDAYKTYIFFVNCLTVFVGYYSFYKMFRNKWAGVVSCGLYTLSVYRITDVYTRHAVGEYTAMAFIPLVIYGIYKIYSENEQDGQRKWLPLAIGYTGIIQSHILSCEMVGLFSVLIGLILWRRTFRKSTILNLVKMAGVVLVLNAAFVIPFLQYYLQDDLKIKFIENENIQGMGLSAAQLFGIYLGSGGLNGRSEGLYEEMAMGLGPSFAIFLLLLFFFVAYNRFGKRESLVLKVVLGMSAAAIWLSSDLFPYDKLAQIGGGISALICSLQFPFRFMGIALALLSCAAGLLALEIKRKDQKLFQWGSVIIIMIVLLQGSIQAGEILNKQEANRFYDEEAIYAKEGGINNAVGYGVEYLPLATDVYTLDQKVILGESVTIGNYMKKFNQIDFSVACDGLASYVEVPLVYYTGYSAQDDKGQQLDISRGTNGKIKIGIPKNYTGSIHVVFREPIVWRICEIISLISILMLVGGMLKRRFYREHGGDTSI